MLIRFFVLGAVWVVLTACATTRREVRDLDFERMQKAEAQFVAEFRAKYARYRVEASEIRGGGVRKGVEIGNKGVELDNGMRLELRLGDRTNIGNGHRSGSRYRLRSEKGALLAEAESAFAKQDLPVTKPKADLYLDAVHSELLLFEEQCWTVQRYILFRRRGMDSTLWESVYLRVPKRDSANGIANEPHILGLSEHRIFVEQDGMIYAFPVDELPREQNLVYTIG